MAQWAERLATIGEVRRFDYAYMLNGKKRPDPLPTLIATHRGALVQQPSNVLIGKSMGSRVGCHVSLEVNVDALVCFGYPLRGQNGKLRDEVLRALRTPILFIQGTRDSLCPLDELEEVRRSMTNVNELYVVEEGDHSLEVTKTWLKKNGSTQEAVDLLILDKIATFARAHAR